MAAGSFYIHQQQKEREAQARAQSAAWAQEREREEKAENQKQFCTAAKEGRLQKVQELISSVKVNGPGINYVDGPTALYLAAQGGHADIVRFLLSNRAEVDKGDENGETPLWIASRNGHLDAVKVLVGSHANLESSSDQMTPLAIAAFFGRVPVVAYLCHHNADTECRSSANNTPLIDAIFNGKIDVIRTLLDKGVNPNLPGNKGFYPLFFAAQENQVEIAELLLNAKADISKGSTQSRVTPLHKAAWAGHEKMVELLLNRGADKDAVAGEFETPLMTVLGATGDGHFSIVEKLVGWGAQVNPPTLPGNNPSPIMKAAYKGNVKIFLYLKEMGADINQANGVGYRTLHYAIIGKQPQIIPLIFTASPDLGKDKGSSCMTIAILKSSPEVIRALHQNGIPIKETDLKLALMEGSLKNAEALLDLGVHIEDDLIFQLPVLRTLNYLPIVKLLLAKRPDLVNKIEVNGHLGETLLHKLIKFLDLPIVNHPDVIDLLLESKADPNASAKGAYKPLHYAAYKKNREVVKKLIDKGAILEPICDLGNTPLLIAASYGNQEMLELFFELGAKIDHQNWKGADALWYSCISGRLEMLEFLLLNNIDPTEHKNDYQKLIADWTPSEKELTNAKSELKNSAAKIVERALSSYEANWQKKKDPSRKASLSTLREELGKAEEIKDVIQAAQNTLSEIEQKKLYSRFGGLKGSTLYQNLTAAVKNIDHLSNVFREVLGEKSELLLSTPS